MTVHRRISRSLLLILGALSAFGPLSMDLYLPSLPALTRSMGASAASGQLTMSACMIGLAAGQLLVGPLSDRYGRRRPLLAGVTVFTLASVGCALAPEINTLIGLRLVQGLAGGAGMVIARAIVRDRHDVDSVAWILSLLTLVTGAAPVLAPVLGGQLLRLGSWRGAFVALTIIGGLLIAACAWGAEESLSTSDRTDGGPRVVVEQLGALFRDPRFVGYTAITALSSAMLFSYISMSPYVFQGRYDLSAQEFSLVFAANSIGLIIAGRLGGMSIRRWSPAVTLTTGLLCGAACAAVLAMLALLGTGLAALLPVLFVTVSTVALILPSGTALALAEHGTRAGAASGVIGLAQFGLGAIVAPLVSALGPTPVTMTTTMTAAAIASLAVYLAFRTIRPAKARRSPGTRPVQHP